MTVSRQRSVRNAVVLSGFALIALGNATLVAPGARAPATAQPDSSESVGLVGDVDTSAPTSSALARLGLRDTGELRRGLPWAAATLRIDPSRPSTGCAVLAVAPKTSPPLRS